MFRMILISFKITGNLMEMEVQYCEICQNLHSKRRKCKTECRSNNEKKAVTLIYFYHYYFYFTKNKKRFTLSYIITKFSCGVS